MRFAESTALPVTAPYRLDLTVAVLRRFSTNLVDVVAPDGTHLRAHDYGAGARFVVAVRQRSADTLDVRVDAAGALDHAVALVRRTLGVDRRPTHFASAAASLPWLAPIAGRMHGMRPPRYATLWEACVNAIVFQQVSIHAAGAILGRVVRTLGTSLTIDGTQLHAFFCPAALLASDDATLRWAGLSVAKIATLRRVANELADGSLLEADLEPLASAAIAERLCAIKGIGPWTAAVILLRGFGRLDVFPQNDSGVARSLRVLTTEPIDVHAALAILAPEEGLLYYHLLLARLEASGLVSGATRDGL